MCDHSVFRRNDFFPSLQNLVTYCDNEQPKHTHQDDGHSHHIIEDDRNRFEFFKMNHIHPTKAT